MTTLTPREGEIAFRCLALLGQRLVDKSRKEEEKSEDQPGAEKELAKLVDVPHDEMVAFMTKLTGAINDERRNDHLLQVLLREVSPK